jgi:hypothetical protein
LSHRAFPTPSLDLKFRSHSGLGTNSTRNLRRLRVLVPTRRFDAMGETSNQFRAKQCSAN